MRLSARMLENVASVNSFQVANQAEFTVGDTPTVSFQLIDSSVDKSNQGFVPAGRRFVPAVGAILTVQFDALDDTRVVTRVATQPFAQDASIWQVTLLPTDNVRGTVNMKLTLNEGGKLTYGYLSAALNVISLEGMTRI